MSNAVVVNTNELPESFKDINSHNLYLYVKSYLAAQRANTARVKNRSEVSGGGKKTKSSKRFWWC